MQAPPRLGAIVLAGGRSSRMGAPKALLDWHGGTLVRRITGILQRLADPVVVVHADGQELPPLVGVERVVDRAPDRGPLEGIAAGLRTVAGRCPAVFVSGTDLPFLHPDLVLALATRAWRTRRGGAGRRRSRSPPLRGLRLRSAARGRAAAGRRPAARGAAAGRDRRAAVGCDRASASRVAPEPEHGRLISTGPGRAAAADHAWGRTRAGVGSGGDAGRGRPSRPGAGRSSCPAARCA